MTGIMIRITQNKSFLCEESRVAGLAIENHFNQGVLGNKKAYLSTGRHCTSNTVAVVLIAATGTWEHAGTIQE